MTDYPANVPQSERLETLLHLLPPLPPEAKAAVLIAVTTVYEPAWVKIEMRNIQMMSEYDGRNMTKLCRKYRISRRNFYHIMHKVKRLRRKCNTDVE